MKVAVIYSTTTGNTEAVANLINEELVANGSEVVFGTADSADVSAVLACDVILLGSPAMGDEVLEDTMEDFYSANESAFNGKKVAVFGSYDWGDGQFLRDWEDRLKAAGAVLVAPYLMVHLAPEDPAEVKNWAKSVL